MSDPTLSDRVDFEAWLARELRRPVPVEPGRTARVMARVRRAPAPVPRRRRWLPPAFGLAVAAGLAGLAALHPLAFAARPGGEARRAAAGLGDTLVATLRDTLGDTIRGAVEDAVCDTAWLVRFALVAPRAARVAIAGDFNGWDPRVTPLTRRRADGTWTAAVALGPGQHRYAFVVDDTEWVADPAAPGASGHPWSVRTVPDSTN